MMEDQGSGSPLSYVERENPKESLNSMDPKELEELVDEPLAKRRSAWCRDILQHAERHGVRI